MYTKSQEDIDEDMEVDYESSDGDYDNRVEDS